ncbi:hypothetical protein BT63DRAFT_422430 [Microthyrium microscopicum]|uniref:Uncharacterized protein n=1 Tax=Microthyrium microscopicum TaxID=703497 RepID=A0A6A6UKB7_9PEZI|nr:hypothetical protein BT63DRAFT_422430 [Microthyrium microscopicum]
MGLTDVLPWLGTPFYVGAWTNWDHGAVMGRTITMPNDAARFLQSFMTAFVVLVGLKSWGMVRYLFHQGSSTQEQMDGLHHQRQAIFRASASPKSTLLHVLKLSWKWRHNADGSIRRQLFFTFFSIIYILIWIGLTHATAALFDTKNMVDVLIRPGVCGFTNPSYYPNSTNNANYTTWLANERSIYQSAESMVVSCYSHKLGIDASASDSCGVYGLPTLPTTITQGDVVCPFSNATMCRDGNTGVFHMETGLLNSHYDLYINAPTANRVDYRKFSTCSRVSQDGFVINHPGDGSSDAFDSNANTNYTDFFYTASSSDPTFSAIDHANVLDLDLQPYYFLYNESSYYPNSPNGTNVWQPIPGLVNSEADMHVFAIQNNAYYSGPSTDLLFGTNDTLCSPADGIFCSPEFNVLSCTEQHQFCLPGGLNCTPIRGLWDLFDAQSFDQFNDAQQNTIILIVLAALQAPFGDMLNIYGADALLARSALATASLASSRALPGDQTQREMHNLFLVTLARLQRNIVNRPVVDDQFKDLLVEQHLGQDVVDALSGFCSTQKIAVTGFTATNLLALVLTLLGGVLIVAGSSLLPKVIGLAERKSDKWEAKNEEWEAGELLNLQRVAYETKGEGNWTDLKGIPVTAKGDKFQFLERPGKRKSTMEMHVGETSKDGTKTEYREVRDGA